MYNHQLSPPQIFTAQHGQNSVLLLLPLLMFVVSLGFVLALWYDAKATAKGELKTEFEFRAAGAVELVKQRMLDYDQVLHGLGGLYAGSKSVERDEFAIYIAEQNLAERYPGVQGFGFVQRVPSAQKEQHIAAIRREGFQSYSIRPEGNREVYAPVVYIEPFTGSNVRAFGYDIYSDPTRRAAMERARDLNLSSITAKIALVQYDGSKMQTGFLMLLPVFNYGMPRSTVAERRANIIGWVDAVFRAEELMSGALDKESKDIDIEIYDGENLSANTLLYDADKILRAGGGSDVQFQVIHQLEVAGRNWTMVVSALPMFDRRLQGETAQTILIAGGALSLLLALSTWILARGRVQSMRSAQELRQELNARKQAEESLRLSALVFERSSEGMLVTNADNHILTVNPAFTRITGYEAAEVLGHGPHYLNSDRHGPEFYDAMREELGRSGHWQGEVWDRRKDGETYAAYLTINTISNEDGSVNRRVAQLLDITEKKESEEFIWRQANFDSLTQLPNRSMFQDRLTQEMKKSQRVGLPLALLLIDLDQFKEVNDTLGHHVGDMLLQEAARRIISCVREMDTVARLGGDEFTIILPELHDVSNADRVVGHILQKLASPFRLGEELVYVSGSVGITVYPRDAHDLDGLMKNADQAMYAAKNRGRNSFSVFTPALQNSAQLRSRLINDLREAIAGDQFSVYYQPIVDLATGRVHKAEALIRWTHPVRGSVSPADFIPLAEETGLISTIGDWVFRQAVSEAQRIRARYDGEFRISVNKSPRQFRERTAGPSEWLDILRKTGVPGAAITIEITEGLLLNAVADVVDKLQAYRDEGIQIAIDDFGTGYSSLAYLKRFRIDFLKIDRSFVRDIETDANDLALSKAIIVMAHALGLKVVAEGVETQAQLKLLAEIGCDYAQGFYFSKAVPASKLDGLVRDGFAHSVGSNG